MYTKNSGIYRVVGMPLKFLKYLLWEVLMIEWMYVKPGEIEENLGKNKLLTINETNSNLVKVWYSTSDTKEENLNSLQQLKAKIRLWEMVVRATGPNLTINTWNRLILEMSEHSAI